MNRKRKREKELAFWRRMGYLIGAARGIQAMAIVGAIVLIILTVAGALYIREVLTFVFSP